MFNVCIDPASGRFYQSFQEAVGKEEVLPENVRNLLAANYEPLLKFHQGFLREVEQRLAQWSVPSDTPLPCYDLNNVLSKALRPRPC